MALTASHRAKATRTKDPRFYGPAANNKENVSPQKPRKQQKRREIHNINAIFDQAERSSNRRAGTRDVLSPKFAGVKKASLGKFGVFSRVKERAETDARDDSVSSPNVEALHDFAKQQKQMPLSFGIAGEHGSLSLTLLG